MGPRIWVLAPYTGGRQHFVFPRHAPYLEGARPHRMMFGMEIGPGVVPPVGANNTNTLFNALYPIAGEPDSQLIAKVCRLMVHLNQMWRSSRLDANAAELPRLIGSCLPTPSLVGRVPTGSCRVAVR